MNKKILKLLAVIGAFLLNMLLLVVVGKLVVPEKGDISLRFRFRSDLRLLAYRKSDFRSRPCHSNGSTGDICDRVRHYFCGDILPIRKSYPLHHIAWSDGFCL